MYVAMWYMAASWTGRRPQNRSCILVLLEDVVPFAAAATEEREFQSNAS